MLNNMELKIVKEYTLIAWKNSLEKRLNEAVSPKVHPQPPPAGDIAISQLSGK
jgi:hypothetical protein